MAKCTWCKKDAIQTFGGLCPICWDADEVREKEK